MGRIEQPGGGRTGSFGTLLEIFFTYTVGIVAQIVTLLEAHNQGLNSAPTLLLEAS